ncbi:MAG: hypothetical protein COV31_02835 [Candidatus Yanofskybacteria bacterium CG10_big_fil_rev_8_21_14_0_10_46_23]|uniref:Uncharacterized protein n=1 Tax=Candidatus Yanofskybacteria bacterium CG10_big_fil_rev_8_21_14_0_10_46_23 TaxID=1975098 RepID=A0A2H0R3W4_9BACT|nr:MAG: hypothetical protein COV31_02835 [Candidatus Yanofskybacteria bacterium CG10_big_fil_rev_8_21_14_0_10_46_23]
MEKVTLKPQSTEFSHKINDGQSFFDALTATPTQKEEAFLGHLYVLGYVTFKDEDMGYLVNLISSLAKREYYSPIAQETGDPKAAFEHTLKKLNEVLEDFFQKKDFELNMGLMVVAGNHVYISRIGKLNVYLVREREIIDVLNNVNLFQKDVVEQKEFSNIISGSIQKEDKLFFFYPSRSITARKKKIEELLIKNGPAELEKRIAELKGVSNNFIFCGVYIEVKEIRESALSPAPGPKIEKTLAPAPVVAAPAGLPGQSLENLPQTTSPVQKIPVQNVAPKEAPVIIRDMSLNKRENIFSKTLSNVRKTQFLGSVQRSAKFSTVGLVVVILFASVLFVRLLGGESRETRAFISEIQDDLKLAQTYVSQNQLAQARGLISGSLASLSNFPEENKTLTEATQSLNALLDRIDLVRSTTPEILYEYGAEANLDKLAGFENRLFGATATGQIVELSDNVTSLAKSEAFPYLFADEDIIVSTDGVGVRVTARESGAVAGYQLKNALPPLDVAFYGGNIYTLEDEDLVKYSDAARGNTTGSSWLKESLIAEPKKITIDGNVYVLNGQGQLAIYFKGEKINEQTIGIIPTETGKLITGNDLDYLVYVDPQILRAMLFDKKTGGLLGSYRLNTVNSEIADVTLTETGELIILTTDQKVWTLPTIR